MPEGSPHESWVEGTDWYGDALKVIAELPDVGLRSDLTDHYHETAAWLEYVQGNDRPVAEMLAFGELLAEVLCRGIDAKAT